MRLCITTGRVAAVLIVMAGAYRGSDEALFAADGPDDVAPVVSRTVAASAIALTKPALSTSPSSDVVLAQPEQNAPRKTLVTLAPGAVDAVVVCPAAWRRTLQPWLTHRASQGHRMVLISKWQSAAHLRSMIQRLAADHPLQYVVLVGDVPATPVEDTRGAGTDVPTFFVPAQVNVRWGSEPEIATDHPYSDLDGDHVPELAVGRLPVHNEEDLRLMLAKILRYELSEPIGGWRHRVHLVAGVGGFGPLTDTVIEFAAKKLLTEGIPPEYDSKMAHCSWRSPYCPSPQAMRRTTLGLHNEGCLFWVYMGHGQRQRLDRVPLPSGEVAPILENSDVSLLASAKGMPVAVLLACYAAAYDSPTDSLAESMLRQPRGPVAVVGGSRVTMPYAMAILGTGMMKGAFQARLDTLGGVMVHAKRELYSPDGEVPPEQKLLDSLAWALSPTRDNLVGERIEHLHLFNLLGDPMTVLEHARPVGVRTSRHVTAGTSLVVQAQTDISGLCTVELVCRRDRMTFTPPTRSKFDGSEEMVQEMAATYERANNHRWATRTLWVEPGTFQTSLQIPPQAKGAAHLRVSVHGENDFGLGSVEVLVQPPVGTATASKPVLPLP